MRTILWVGFEPTTTHQSSDYAGYKPGALPLSYQSIVSFVIKGWRLCQPQNNVHSMLRVGLEPTRSYDQKILNLPSLPISSSEHIMGYAGVEPARDAIPRGLKPRVSTSSTNSPYLIKCPIWTRTRISWTRINCPTVGPQSNNSEPKCLTIWNVNQIDWNRFHRIWLFQLLYSESNNLYQRRGLNPRLFNVFTCVLH